MRLSYRQRRTMAILVLLVALPVYIVVVVNVIGRFDRLPVILELLAYLVAGVAWAPPLRFVFLGVGKPNPDSSTNADDTASRR